MDKIEHFLSALRRAGAAVVHRRAPGEDPESEAEFFESLSMPTPTPPDKWIDASRPGEVIVMTGGRPRPHRGGQAAAKPSPATQDEDEVQERKRPSAAALKRKIEKLRREVAKLEARSAKKTG